MSIPRAFIDRTPSLRDDVGFCFLKPDYTGIAKEFTRDLWDNGLDVAHAQDVVLTQGLMDYIYSDSRGEDFYDSMTGKLGGAAVRAMVVLRRPSIQSSSRGAQGILESLKRGFDPYPNLRQKYHRPEHKLVGEEFAKWERKALPPDRMDNITFKLTQQNVFHASDGPHDAIGTLIKLREYNGFFDNPEDPRMIPVIGKLDKIIQRRYRERNMLDVSVKWQVLHSAPEDSIEAPIRQVYVWLMTSDNHMVIVSKDDNKWQLPGGKPDSGETVLQTAVREVFEETGIDVEEIKLKINFFGEYTIDDLNKNSDNPPRYRQVRSWLRLPQDSRELDLTTAGESSAQRPEDAVRFVKVVPIADITSWIPWMPKADEYKYLRRTNIIDKEATL